jgi:hypothetical protein
MINSKYIRERVLRHPEQKIINAQQLYTKEFEGFSELAFYKQLSRLEKEGHLVRVTRGVYCRPKKSRFGPIATSEKQIIEYFLGAKHRNGVIVGYRMYNNYGLTTQISKKTNLYSNIVDYDVMNIQNVVANKASLSYDEETKKLIELLDILENYQTIEDLNRKSMISLIKSSVKSYSNTKLEKILKVIKFKKSTLASLKNTLDFFDIENNVGEYLNKTSKYKTFNMEVLHDTAS